MINFKEQLKISEELGDKRGISNALADIGIVFDENDDHRKALEYFDKAIEIDEALNIKSKLPIHLFIKANCLYSLARYNESLECGKKSLAISKEVDNKFYSFTSEVLIIKTNFKLYDDLRLKQQQIEKLKYLLNAETEKENLAVLNFELSLMLHELKNDESNIYIKTAISEYKELYETTLDVGFRNRYLKLEHLI